MSNISQLDRANIVILYEKDKWSARKISKELRLNIHTVLLWINRYKQTGEIKENHKKGRNKKTTKVE